MMEIANLTEPELQHYIRSLKVEMDRENNRIGDRLEGERRGEKRGERRGEKRGIRKRELEIAKKMLQRGTPVEFIKEMTGLSLEQIQALNKDCLKIERKRSQALCLNKVQ